MVPKDIIKARDLGLPRSVHLFVLSANPHVDTERKKAGGDMALQRGHGLAGQIEARRGLVWSGGARSREGVVGTRAPRRHALFQSSADRLGAD